MTDESNAGQAPDPQTDAQAASEEPTTSAEATSDDSNAELSKLRAEAAKWRTKLRETESQLKEVSPLAQKYAELQEAQKSTEQKQAEQIAALEAQVAESQAQAAKAAAEAKLTRYASAAGVDAEVVALLDLSKLDLDDEQATIATLQKLAGPATRSGGSSNPGRNADGTESEEELLQWLKNRGKNNIMFSRSS